MNDLERARLIAQEDLEREALRARLPQLEAEAAQDARTAAAAGRLARSETAARMGVETAEPVIAEWRAWFIGWAKEGWAKILELQPTEQSLWRDLSALAGAAASSIMATGIDDSGAGLAPVEVDREVNAALDRVGALSEDLWPLPEMRGNPWAEEIKSVMLRFLGTIYSPAQRCRQFKKSQPSHFRR